MLEKLKTLFVYLGVCTLFFSCVPNEADFYEKDFPEELPNELGDRTSQSQQEDALESFDSNQSEDNFVNDEIVLQATEPDVESVIVYTDVEGTPVEVSEDDIIDINDGTSNNDGESDTTTDVVDDGPGDDEIPEELSGNSDSSTNSDAGSTDGSSDSSNEENSNSDNGVTNASNENTNETTEGQENGDNTTSNEEGNISTEQGTSDETGNDSTSEDVAVDQGTGTSNEGSSNEGGDDTVGDETASNESGGTEGENDGSGNDGEDSHDQTADNGDNSDGSEGTSSTEGDSNSTSEEVTDNGNGDDSTTGDSDSSDNSGSDNETASDGGDGSNESGSDNETGDNTTNEEVADDQNQSEGDEGTSGEQVSDNGAGENSNTSSTNDGESNEPEEEDQPVIVVTEEDQEFVDDVEVAVDNDQYICDPFEGEEGNTSFQGIAGFVYDGLSHPYNDVHDYYLFGNKSQTPIFMPEINTPTTKFDQGFEINDGNFIQNAFGGKLFEYFALDLRGQIRLGDLEEEGHYQFAVISDDGSIFEIDQEGELKEHINNNQLTPTRMKCGSKPIYFDHETKKKFRMKYFQGPRMHIALMLMWRKVDPNNVPAEEFCGKGGNGLFFDFNQSPSQPKAKYYELLSRGWKPLDSQNFLLPEGLRENPCGNEQPEIEKQCFSEEIVLDGRNWFHFDGDSIDTSSIKITDENGEERSHHYLESRKRIRIGGSCLRGQELKVSYCEQ